MHSTHDAVPPFGRDGIADAQFTFAGCSVVVEAGCVVVEDVVVVTAGFVVVAVVVATLVVEDDVGAVVAPVVSVVLVVTTVVVVDTVVAGLKSVVVSGAPRAWSAGTLEETTAPVFASLEVEAMYNAIEAPIRRSAIPVRGPRAFWRRSDLVFTSMYCPARWAFVQRRKLRALGFGGVALRVREHAYQRP